MKKTNIFKRIIRYVSDPKYRFGVNSRKFGRFYEKLSDERYIKKEFKAKIGYKLDLTAPKTYNEKLQWLKLYDRKPLYTKLVDKYLVREYIKEKIGEEYLIPLIAVWDRAEDIDFDKLPNQFVLKCNHNSGGLYICRDKSKLTEIDFVKIRKDLTKALSEDYYITSREWPYKDVKRKIIAEKLMVDESGYELKDYKFFCFDGKVKALFIASDRTVKGAETKFDFFDENFERLPFTNGHPNSDKEIIKPEGFEEMKKLAEKLSEGFRHLRVDLYNINGKIYFGELTFYHWGGMVKFEPEKWDRIFGDWLVLPSDKESK